MSECYCDQCSGHVPCWATGDHDYADNGRCQECGDFNGRLLAWRRQDKAEKEGRHHGDHFHHSIAAASSCKRPTHDETDCADKGGCLHHEPSDKWCEQQTEVAA